MRDERKADHSATATIAGRSKRDLAIEGRSEAPEALVEVKVPQFGSGHDLYILVAAGTRIYIKS